MKLVGVISKKTDSEGVTLSERLNLPLVEKIKESGIYFSQINSKFTCILFRDQQKIIFSLDFERGRLGYRKRGSGKELLLKALGTVDSNTLIVDATMGFAEDSLLLTNSGAQVVGIEQNLFVYTLVEDALRRSENYSLSIVHARAEDYFLQNNKKSPDIIYLDPMFPASKNKAQVKKEMQILRALNKDIDTNEEALFAIAMENAKDKVIVKRPITAKIIGDNKVSYQIKGKNIRYDIFRK